MLLIFSILILVMSVVIHEVSHGYAAYLQGDITAKYQGRLTLNPIAHIDPLGSIMVPIVTSLAGVPFGWAKPVPFNPYNLKNQRWGEIIVAAAGPLSNILIALVFSLILRFGLGMVNSSFISLALQVIIVNISLALFNLIPIPPLDGSKIVFGLLPRHLSKIRWELERYSMFLVLILILVPAFSTFLSRFIIFFTVLMTGFGVEQLVHYLTLLR